jgi:hypothetical protein
VRCAEGLAAWPRWRRPQRPGSRSTRLTLKVLIIDIDVLCTFDAFDSEELCPASGLQTAWACMAETDLLLPWLGRDPGGCGTFPKRSERFESARCEPPLKAPDSAPPPEQQGRSLATLTVKPTATPQDATEWTVEFARTARRDAAAVTPPSSREFCLPGFRSLTLG